MPRSSPVDGFSLAYDRTGDGPPVVLLHGWPGGRADYRLVGPCWPTPPTSSCRTCGGSGSPTSIPWRRTRGTPADAQARSVTGLLDELGLGPVVLAGYDIGSRIAQTIARQFPERVRALVVTPPMPGAGQRLLNPRRPDRVLVPELPPAGPFRPAAGRRPGRRPDVPRALLDALVRSRVHAGRRGPRPAGRHLRAAGGVHVLDRLVPGGTGHPGPGPGRAGSRTGGAARRPYTRALAGARPAVPARLGRSPRRVLRRRLRDAVAGLRALRAARGTRGVRLGDPGGSRPSVTSAVVGELQPAVDGVTTALTGRSWISRGSSATRSSSNTTVTSTASGRAWTSARS